MSYLEGNEYITYTPVEAYSVSTFADGIISGGGGDEAVVTQGTRFYWIYNPENLQHSGFTGVGWFDKTPGSPIAESGISIETILAEFAAGSRADLNDVFTAWQAYVNKQAEQGNTTVVTTFVNALVIDGGGSCWHAG